MPLLTASASYYNIPVRARNPHRRRRIRKEYPSARCTYISLYLAIQPPPVLGGDPLHQPNIAGREIGLSNSAISGKTVQDIYSLQGDIVARNLSGQTNHADVSVSTNSFIPSSICPISLSDIVIIPPSLSTLLSEGIP